MELLAQIYPVGGGGRDLTLLALVGGGALMAFGGLELLVGHAYWFGVGERSAFGPIRLARSDGGRFLAACLAKMIAGGVLLAWFQAQH